MKLLFDNNLSYKLVSRLADIFAASAHVRFLDMQTANDREIWGYAKEHEYAIVTKDSDFNDMSVLYGHPPKIVWLKLGNNRVAVVEAVMRKNASRIVEFFQAEDDSVLEIEDTT